MPAQFIVLYVTHLATKVLTYKKTTVSLSYKEPIEYWRLIRVLWEHVPFDLLEYDQIVLNVTNQLGQRHKITFEKNI